MIAWSKRWLALLKRYARPPERYSGSPLFEDEEENRVAGLLHRSAWLLLLLALLAWLYVWFMVPEGLVVGIAVVVPFFVVSLAVLYLVQHNRLTAASWLLVATVLITVTWLVVGYRGLRDLMITGYFVAAILARLLVRGRAPMIVSLGSVAVMVALYVAEVSGILVPELEETVPPFQLAALLAMFVLAVSLVRFAAQGNVLAFDQVRSNAAALRAANRELENSRDVMADRTAALERRSAYLQASSEVAYAIASILDVERLLERVVELIRERFGLYYVGIFLVDEASSDQERWVRLRAGTGPAGQAMLARGHRLRVGEGMIGWSVAQGEARVAQEAQVDQVRVTTAELPETRSEAALPLKSRGRVQGAITVQDTRAGTFDPEAVSVLQALADQVAVALDNARLLRESQSALEAERHAYGEASAHGWAQMVRQGRELGYLCRPGGDLIPAQGAWTSDMVRANVRGEMVVNDGNGSTSNTVAVPIKIRDRILGVIRLRKSEEGQAWTREELALMETLTSQLEVALESARLYEDTQRRAAQERLVGEVTARMRETLDMDAVLRTAAQEIRQALGLSQLTVRLAAEADDPQSEGTRQ